MPDTLAVIAGSGFDGVLAGTDIAPRATPWGDMSAAPRRVLLGSRDVIVLDRHGAPPVIPAHRVDYRANIAGLADLGVRAVIGLNTVGGITGRAAPGTLAVPADLIDYTWGRETSFFNGKDEGLQHIDFSEPFSGMLRRRLVAAARRAGVDCCDGGVYAVTQGPRLETAAEIDRLERDGADYVGMTAMPEAGLARERGIDYACVALVVNAAAGRGQGSIHQDVERHSAGARRAALALLEALLDGDSGDAERS